MKLQLHGCIFHSIEYPHFGKQHVKTRIHAIQTRKKITQIRIWYFFPCDTKEVISGSRDCGSWGLKHLLDPCLKICINPIILQLAIRENSNASQLCPASSYLRQIGQYLQIFLLKAIYFTQKWFLTEHTLNTLNTFFTLMSCTGKRPVFTS